MDIIDVDELASYLRDTSVGTDAAPNPAAAQIVILANAIVTEAVGDELFDIPARVTAVTLEVAARAWRNPEGFSSETIDDYTYQRTSETQRAGVYLTDKERSDLEGGITPRSFVGWM